MERLRGRPLSLPVRSRRPNGYSVRTLEVHTWLINHGIVRRAAAGKDRPIGTLVLVVAFV